MDLADIAPLPDFKLIPREEEAEVCRYAHLAVANYYLIFLKLNEYFRVTVSD